MEVTASLILIIGFVSSDSRDCASIVPEGDKVGVRWVTSWWFSKSLPKKLLEIKGVIYEEERTFLGLKSRQRYGGGGQGNRRNMVC